MSRLSRRGERVDAPETDVRRRLLQEIAAQPGVHMRELERRLGISLSGISHHVQILERQGVIVGISDGHYRRYFSRDLVLPSQARRISEDDRRLLAECRRPMSLAIVLNLAVEGRLRHGELTERLGKSKSTISFHLSRLLESGHVRLAHESSADSYEIVDPLRVVALLVTFSDTLRDHVDTFADLWRSLSTRDVEKSSRP